MRRSNNIQPSPLCFSSEMMKREEKRQSTTLIREKKRNNIPTSDAAKTKKTESSETKKLERKTTEDINASAEAFINSFKQQLRIQRLQSIENYEQMLARGL